MCISQKSQPSATTAAMAAEGWKRLDETAFPRFAPLLKEAQDYANLSGCRFRSSSFKDLGDVDPATGLAVVGNSRASDPGPRLAAKLRAAPRVREFTERLNGDEPGLVEELDRAFRVVMVETVRNAMRGLFKQLDMFPPPSPPVGISDEDCSYEDVTEPLPVIAQRLYNDEVRRLHDVAGAYGPRLERRALTAAFIVDFAEGAGRVLPTMPETQQMMLREFAQRTEEYGAQGPVMGGASNPPRQADVREAFLQALGPGSVADKIRQDVQTAWGEHRGTILAAAAGGLLLGAAALLRARQQNQQRQDGQREAGSPGGEGASRWHSGGGGYGGRSS
eukprot:TRINITY_DN91518_c0_g1_i1.p1 TRINITY_DN91518_c0_g1~~TRINITY_DN91518_c0_g1_i1.p1  ORF type:complete len:334 (+),score=61.55 TRINITY_DN91518_c0_g1_i1:53-1054(+)